MPSDADLDRLIEAYSEGLYAMDSKTTFPFWDYDMAPLFSREWIAKIATAIERLANMRPGRWDEWFRGPSVPRKELIYSLVDMKVAELERDTRLRIVDYWIDVLKDWCGDDWLADGANRPRLDEPPNELARSGDWVADDPTAGAAIGRLTVAAHALTYSLYSDVFAHQSGEFLGPYELVPRAGSPTSLCLRTWSELEPLDLWPEFRGPGPSSVTVAAVYEDRVPTVDIYNHVHWPASPARMLRRYRIWVDGAPAAISPADITELANSIAAVAREQFTHYRALGRPAHMRLWVRQRNHQFRRFFAAAGLPWEAPEMEAAVEGRELLDDPFWDRSFGRERLFSAWSRFLDPRVDLPYQCWTAEFDAEASDCDGGGPLPPK
jgi:hypothetical protein